MQKAARLAPENWDVQKRLILHLGERGQIVAAISALRAIHDQQPWRADTWRVLGDLWAHVRSSIQPNALTGRRSNWTFTMMTRPGKWRRWRSSWRGDELGYARR